TTGGLLLLDVATCACAALTLLAVRFPPLPSTPRSPPPGFAAGWRDSVRYVQTQPGLRPLLVFLVLTGFLNGVIGALIYPLILSFAPPAVPGGMVALAGGGMLTSSAAMSVWGGPRRLVRGLLAAQVLFGCGLVLIGARPDAGLVACGALLAHLAFPISTA